MRVPPREKSHSDGACFVFVFFVTITDLYFDLIFKCFNLLYEKVYINIPSSLGTGTVTVAFSFLEDVI